MTEGAVILAKRETRLEIARKLITSAAWLALAYLLLNPVSRAVVALLAAWTHNATDPLAGVR